MQRRRGTCYAMSKKWYYHHLHYHHHPINITITMIIMIMITIIIIIIVIVIIVVVVIITACYSTLRRAPRTFCHPASLRLRHSAPSSVVSKCIFLLRHSINFSKLRTPDFILYFEKCSLLLLSNLPSTHNKAVRRRVLNIKYYNNIITNNQCRP